MDCLFYEVYTIILYRLSKFIAFNPYRVVLGAPWVVEAGARRTPPETLLVKASGHLALLTLCFRVSWRREFSVKVSAYRQRLIRYTK